MTQQVIHCRVLLKSRDPEVDNPSFGFTFEATGSDTGFTFDDTSPIAALLNAMDNGVTTFTQNTSVVTPYVTFPGQYISPSMSRVTGDLQVITTDITGHLSGTPTGAPLRIDTSTLPPATHAGTLPEGCAVGLSWRAPYGSASEFVTGARPRSRYRNRCYFGPVVDTANAMDSTGASRVASPITDDLGVLMSHLGTNNTTVGHTGQQWDLVAWSRKDAAVRDAEFFAISERFDYQRRRTERITNEDWLAIS